MEFKELVFYIFVSGLVSIVVKFAFGEDDDIESIDKISTNIGVWLVLLFGLAYIIWFVWIL